MSTPFLLGPAEEAALRGLRELAARSPVEMQSLAARLATPEGKAAHMRQMTAQTIELPFGYMVTFSVESGHPIGAARHMSMSSPAEGRVPRPEAVWIVAELLGFAGSLEQCVSWPETLEGHGLAINLVQPLAVSGKDGHA